MKSPVLYSFRRCPYAIRARLAIAYSQVSVELREVILKDKPAEMLALSPKGTVPVLLTLEGQVIEESIDVMHWALDVHDPDHWYHGVPQEQIEHGKRLITENDKTFKYYLDRYKYFERYPEQSQQSYRKQCEGYLSVLEDCLSQHRFLLSENISWTDMAILPFVRQFAFVDKSWFDECKHNKVKFWLEDFLVSELFQQVMQKYQQWQAPDAGACFPQSNG